MTSSASGNLLAGYLNLAPKYFYLEMSVQHICKCKQCRNVIARVVEEVLDAVSDQEDHTSDTEEYDDDLEEEEGATADTLVDLGSQRKSRAPFLRSSSGLIPSIQNSTQLQGNSGPSSHTN